MPEVGYIVLEVQTYADGTVGVVPPVHFLDSDQAESAYHSALAAAAISNLPRHSVSLLTTEGYLQEARCYTHPQTSNQQSS